MGKYPIASNPYLELCIGTKPVHGIDDAVAEFVFDKCVEKENGYVYFPGNIDIE